MNDNDKFPRREFIKRTAGALAVGTGIQALAQSLAGTAAFGDNKSSGTVGAGGKSSGYKISPWTGDDFTMGHKMRDGQLPKFPQHAEMTVDVVIIGGGMSGLSAAHYLRDHDFLLLEQYDQLGGQSRGSSHNGIGYSYGAAYIGAEEGTELNDLISELGLKPVKLDPKKNSWRWENEWLSGIEGETKDLYRSFKKLRDDAAPVIAQIEKAAQLMPLTDPSFAKLDQTPFISCLAGHDPKFIALLDAVCRSSNCIGVQRSSALAGYLVISDLIEPSRVFEGGNPAIARALVTSLGGPNSSRCKTGTFVWSVNVADNNVSVVYSSKDGVVHKVNARFAIICTPQMVTARIITGVPDTVKGSMLSFKYGSFLVANLLLKKKIFSGAYDNWVTPPYTFADIVEADKPYEVGGSYKDEMGSVLTVYQPYEPGSAGRPLLLVGDRQEFSQSIVQQIAKVIPGIEPNVEEVVLSRWGHAMTVPSVGFYKKMSALMGTTTGAYALAHCSTQGAPCAEGAVRAGKLAANRALNAKGKKSYTQFGINPIARTLQSQTVS